MQGNASAPALHKHGSPAYQGYTLAPKAEGEAKRSRNSKGKLLGNSSPRKQRVS